MSKYEVEIYINDRGRAPFAKWMDSLSNKLHDKVARKIVHLKLGNFGDTKSIRGGKSIYEIRLHDGPGYRIYFGKKGNTLVVLLCAGQKSTQKKDIEKAQIYWQDYLNNN